MSRLVQTEGQSRRSIAGVPAGTPSAEEVIAMMWGYYPGMGWWMILTDVVLLALIGVAVWAMVRWVGHLTRTSGDRSLGGPTTGPSAEEILRQRYARGEIDAATYEQMRERLDATQVRQPTDMR